MADPLFDPLLANDKALSFEQVVTSLKEWLAQTSTTLESTFNRGWCWLGLDKTPTFENVKGHFDRKALNDKYVERVINRDSHSKEPHSYVQAEINLIYGMHKSFSQRHKTRLQLYRDDLAQKKYFTPGSIDLGHAVFQFESQDAEKTH